MSVNRLRRLIRRSATPGEPATTRRQNDDRKSQVGGGALLCSVLLGAEGGEEDYVADRGGVGQEHHEAVHADAQAGRGGQAVLEGAEVVLVDDHRLGVARRLDRTSVVSGKSVSVRVNLCGRRLIKIQDKLSHPRLETKIQ